MQNPITTLTLKVERRAIYASNHAPTCRESTKRVVVYRAYGDGRWFCKIGPRPFVLSQNQSGCTLSSADNRRPVKYDVNEITGGSLEGFGHTL